MESKNVNVQEQDGKENQDLGDAIDSYEAKDDNKMINES